MCYTFKNKFKEKYEFSKKILCLHLMFCQTFSGALMVYTFYYLTKHAQLSLSFSFYLLHSFI